MLINGYDEVYFFDRDYNVFKVTGLRFPHRKDLNKHLKGTLIDGVKLQNFKSKNKCFFLL